MPKTQDPEYVRLVTRLQTGMIVDTFGSGWSISGMDVRKFPKDRAAAKYVRAAVNEGKLEPASQAEWEEVHDPALAEAVLAANPDFQKNASGFQEAHLQKAAAESRRRLEDARQRRLEEDDDYEDEEDARQRNLAERIAQQQEDGLDSDDPEEQKAISHSQRPRKKSSKKR